MQEHIKYQDVYFEYIRSQTNLADFLTKVFGDVVRPTFDCTASDSLKSTKCVGYRCLYGLRVPPVDMG